MACEADCQECARGLNYNLIAKKSRDLLLCTSLNLFGLPAVATRAIPFDNEYQEVMPEAEHVYPDEDYETLPATTIDLRVLLDKPIEGLLMDNNVISLTDKLETQYTLTTNTLLLLEDRLEITFPDGRTLHLRITERLTTHALTTIGNKYVGVVI